MVGSQALRSSTDSPQRAERPNPSARVSAIVQGSDPDRPIARGVGPKLFGLPGHAMYRGYLTCFGL